MGSIFDPINPDNNGIGNDLMNFGFATMAAANQHDANGFSTYGGGPWGAIGAGGQAAMQAARENAAARANIGNTQQEMYGKQLNNALALRGVNLGNAAFGIDPITMAGVPDLLHPQKSNTPSSAPVSGSVSVNAGMDSPGTSTRTAPAGGGQGQSSEDILKSFNISQGAREVVMQGRTPHSANEAMEAARLANLLGKEDLAKQLTSTALKTLDPYDSRQGNLHSDGFGNYTINPAHVEGIGSSGAKEMLPFASAPVTYGAGGQQPPAAGGGMGGRNVGGGVNSVKTGFSPGEESAQKSFYGPETASYNGAQKAMQNLELMQHSIDTLNTDPNFLSTGAWGENRLEAAQGLNEFASTFGLQPFDTKNIAAGESLLKTTGRLGFDLSRQLGSREAASITQQAIALNPGIETSPKGIVLLKNSIQEEAQRVIDEHNFKSTYYQQNGFNQQKAEAAFDAQYKPELYAKRAYSQIDPIKVNTPAGVKGLLAGTKIMTPDKKIKIIPPNIGVTSPTTQQSVQPTAAQNPQQAEKE